MFFGKAGEDFDLCMAPTEAALGPKEVHDAMNSEATVSKEGEIDEATKK